MILGLTFAFWRFMEIITLIPTLGMLSYFVNIYTQANALTPTSILVLFIVSVLATIWAIATLFTYHRSKSNSHFVSFVDVCFVGAFIAGSWYLRGVGSDDCTQVTIGSYTLSLGLFGSFTYAGLGLSTNKVCSMLKASWVFAIMNCIFFAITALVAFMFGDVAPRKETYVRETHYSRRGHRRSGSHRSHRSSHSGRTRPYV